MSAPDAMPEVSDVAATPRRGFLAVCSSLLMALGLTAGYGTFAAMAVRFLFPARRPRTLSLFVARVGDIAAGQSLTFKTPSGQTVSITRFGESGAADDFIALSSVCPHLGCQVHWEAVNNRFFCPCHNGAFDSQGRATAGPPFDAGQSLSRYSLSVDGDLLFIEMDATDAA